MRIDSIYKCISINAYIGVGNEGIDVLLLQTTIEIALEHLSTHDVVPKVQRYVRSKKWNVIHPYSHVIDFE